MTAPLAHAGHWYHAVLYVLPVILIALGLWWTGRKADTQPPTRPPDPDGD